MTIGTPALVALVGCALLSGGLLVLGACLVWFYRNRPRL